MHAIAVLLLVLAGGFEAIVAPHVLFPLTFIGWAATAIAVGHRPAKIFRIKRVCEFAGGVNPSTIYRWVRAGRFPPPVQLGPNSIGWTEHVLEEWQAGRERITYEQERPRAVRRRTR